MAIGTGVEIQGLKEFRRELRKMSAKLPREMVLIHKKAARMVATLAKAAAPKGTKSAISGRGTKDGAFIDIGTTPVRALGVFMGARKRFGWYAAPWYASSSGKQFEPWVGNQWDPGETSGKPYHIGTPINKAMDRVEEMMGDEIEKLASRAFPDGDVTSKRSFF